MNFFRSEEHVARFNAERSLETGATISSGKLCELSHAWWNTRLAPDWRPRTRNENQAIFERHGLSGEFWQLGG